MSTETEPQVETQAPELTEREQLIQAVREAGGTESANVEAEAREAAERAAASGTPAPEADKPEPTPEPEPDRLAAILRAREEKHAELEAQRSRARSIEEDAQRRAEQTLREAQEKAQRLIDEQLAQHRAQFAAGPTAALRAMGLTSQEAIDQVLAENDPKAKAIAEARQRAEAAERTAAQAVKTVEEVKAWREQQAAQAEQARQQQARDVYLSQLATKDAAPYLHARFDPDQIFEASLQTYRDWTQGGLKYQVDFDDRDVLAYLEKQSKERVTKLVPPTTPAASQVGAGAPATVPGNAPKVTASSPRTLSAAQGSERRAAPKPLSEMTAAQQRQALIEEVAAARRANPDADW